MQKQMAEKLRKEHEAEIHRMKQEARAARNAEGTMDPELKKQMDREKQIAIQKEMSQYRITPDIVEDNINTNSPQTLDYKSDEAQRKEDEGEAETVQCNPFEGAESDKESADIEQKNIRKTENENMPRYIYIILNSNIYVSCI